jgi:hypothetical protein
MVVDTLKGAEAAGQLSLLFLSKEADSVLGSSLVSLGDSKVSVSSARLFHS